MTVRLSQLFSRIGVALPKMDSTKQFQKPSSSHMKSNRANIPKYVLISWAITWVLFKIDNNKILKYHFSIFWVLSKGTINYTIFNPTHFLIFVFEIHFML